MKNFVVMVAALMFETAGTDTGGGTAEVVEPKRAEVSAEVKAAFVAGELAKRTEAVQTAVTEGHLVASYGEVEITGKASPTKKGVVGPYLVLDAQDARGQLALAGKLEPATPKPAEGDDTRTDAQKAPGACDFFNYGFDLDVRAKVRAKLMATLEGPDKAIAKAVASLVANTGMDEASALAFVKTQRAKAGLAV